MSIPVTHRARTSTAPPGARGPSRFDSHWSDTLEDLQREARQLGAAEIVLETGHTPGQLTNDGRPRASARPPGDPAVVVWLIGTRQGDIGYPCGTFDHWHDNVRAVALALEALRKVGRYGVARNGEQYVGFRALPAGGESSVGTGPVARGRELIQEHGSVRAAQRATHPDHGGDAAEFQAVQAAADASTGQIKKPEEGR